MDRIRRCTPLTSSASWAGVASEGSSGFHGWCRSLNGTGCPRPQRSSGRTTCCSERRSGRISRTFCGLGRKGGSHTSHWSGVDCVLLALASQVPGDRGPTCLGRLTSRSVNFYLMMTAMRSPTTPRSEVSSPRQKFDSEMLKVYMKKLLPATLRSSVWPPSKDRDQVKLWIKEIGERVKERMLGARRCRSAVVFSLTNTFCL